MDSKDLRIVKSKLRLRRTEEGGRKTGVKSGYRPDHVFEYRNDGTFSAYIGDIRFDEHDTIEPGEEKIVTVRFIPRQPIKDLLTVGRHWWIYEGPILVGEADIIEV
jgi:hypothetical protein